MKLLLLLGLCVLATANLPNPSWLEDSIQLDQSELYQYQDHEFRSGREYRYNYNGQLATGLPGASKQHSATRIQAIVSVIFKTEREVLLQLTHIRMGRLNQHIPNPKELITFQAFEKVPIEPQLMAKLQKPVKFTYENGLVKDVIFDNAEEPWSANIKRAVMNLLQLDIKGVRRTDRITGFEEIETPDQQQDFFSTLENTLEGECETLYTITREPCTDAMRCREATTASQQVLNVTKSINFDRCNRRPEIKYNFRFQDYCPSCEKKYAEPEKLIESSTLVKYNISGTRDRFLIESACVESQHSFVPFKEDKDIITSYINATLELLSTGPIQTRVPEPVGQIQSDSDMIYSPDWDILKEQFFQEGEQDFLEETPYSEINDKTRFVAQILRRLLEQLPPHQEIKPEAPRQFARLVKVLRMSKKHEIQSIIQSFYLTPTSFTPEQHKIVKEILIDALGVCATVDCTKELIEKTKQQKISTVRASWALKSLVSVRVPSSQIVDEILSLCEPQQPICERSPLLKQTVYLTAGSVLNGLCSETPDKWAIDFKKMPGQQLRTRCPRPLKLKYVQLFKNKIERATNWYEKVLYLKALGNSGIDIAVFELEKIIKNVEGEHSPLVRKEAIIALRQMKETMPRKIQKILMPVYMNRWEIPSVRITAVYQLLQTQPDKAILDQIAKKLFSERSRQVASFVFSYSHTLANSTDPCEKRLADDLKMSLRHARGLPVFQIMESWFMHNSFYCPENKAGFSLDLAHVISNYSTVPSIMGAALHGNYFGFWQKYLASLVLVQENAQKFIGQYLGQDSLFHGQNIEELIERRRSPRSLVPDSRSELSSIFRRLNIRSRRVEEAIEPKAFAALKIKDQEVFILPVSLSTMPLEILALFASGKFDISPIERYLSQGMHFNVHSAGFLHEINRKVPTAIGLPLMLNVKVPTVARMAGSLRAQLQTPGQMLNKMHLEADLKPALVSTLVAKMECWSPVVNTGLKVLNQARINAPIKAKIEWNKYQTGSTQPKLIVTLKTVKERNELVTLEARPVTMTRVWPKTMQVWQEPQEITVPCEELKKISTYDKQFGDKALGMKYRLKKTTYGSPLKYKIKIIREPGLQAPDEFVFKISSDKWAELMQTGLSPSKLENIEQMVRTECQQVCQQYSEQSQPCEECRSQEYSSLREKGLSYLQTYTGAQSKQSQFKLEIYTTGSSVPRRLDIRAQQKCDIATKICKWEMDLTRSPVPTLETQPWQLECRAELLFPRTPYNLNEISADKQLFKNVKCRWGSNEQEKQTKFITIDMRAQQSWEQRQQLRTDYETAFCRQCLAKSMTTSRNFMSQVASEEEERCRAFCSPVSVYNQVAKWSDLAQIDYLIKYQNVAPEFQNLTNKVYRAVKHMFYWESDVSQIKVRNAENIIRAQVKIEPLTHRFMNVSIQTPREETKFTNIESKIPLPVPNARKYFASKFPTANPLTRFLTSIGTHQPQPYQQPTCKVSSHKIETFDGVKYRVPLTTCYSVLAKDCGNVEESKFAVLMKKKTEGSEQKKMKILTRLHRVECEPTPAGDKIKVTVNGQQLFETPVQTSFEEQIFTQQQQQMTEPNTIGGMFESQQTLHEVVEHGHKVLLIKKTGPYMKIELPEAGLTVYYDGYAANIKMSQLYKQQQCGLCGQYDLETSNEFYTSQGEESSSFGSFFSSYLLEGPEHQCQIGEEERRRVQDESQYIYKPMGSSSWNTNNWITNPLQQQQQQQQQEGGYMMGLEDSDESSESMETLYEQEQQIDEDSIFNQQQPYYNQDQYKSIYNKQQYRTQGMQQQPIKKTKVVEYGHEICFSQQPVEQCPPHTYAQAISKQKTVIYVCVPRSSQQAEVLHQKALRFERIPEIATFPASFSKPETVPAVCVGI